MSIKDGTTVSEMTVEELLGFVGNKFGQNCDPHGIAWNEILRRTEKPSTTNLSEVILAMRNGDYDHFDDNKLSRVWEELKSLLDCDDFDLRELVNQLVDFGVEDE